MKTFKILLLFVLSTFIIASCMKEQMNNYSESALDQTSIHSHDNVTGESYNSGNNNVTLCHWSEDEGTWHVINVNENAVPAHVNNHGDVILVDADGDGWVAAENECVPGGDCNDNDATINPGAEEVCGDGIDNNCDGQVDENCITACWAEVYNTFPYIALFQYCSGNNGLPYDGLALLSYGCSNFEGYFYIAARWNPGGGFGQCLYATPEGDGFISNLDYETTQSYINQIDGLAAAAGFSNYQCGYNCPANFKGGETTENLAVEPHLLPLPEGMPVLSH